MHAKHADENRLNDAHHAQCLDYLKASCLRLALLLNFGGPRLGIKRMANEV